MIDIKGLRVVYGRTVAIGALDLAVGTGVSGLFGQNGSGKSTLLRAVAGLLRPVSGSIEIFGRSPRELWQQRPGAIGYAGHEAGLYGTLTVSENLELFGRLYNATSHQTQEAVESLELEKWLNVQARSLSAGLQRRVSVARSIQHDPLVLLLDEPYANLDDEAAELVSRAVIAWRGPDRCALIATHGAKKVKPYADAGIILRNGNLVMSGDYKHVDEQTAGTMR